MQKVSRIHFATSSKMKFLEFKEALGGMHVILESFTGEVEEIKSDSIREIAEDKARKYFVILKKPVICTDGGIFIDQLNGFPGANSKFVAQKIGATGILTLMEEKQNRVEALCNNLL
jgi:XTP/dITP diphosphohydrolase